MEEGMVTSQKYFQGANDVLRLAVTLQSELAQHVGLSEKSLCLWS